MKKILLFLGFMVLGGHGFADELATALELEGDAERGKQVYRLCANCHYATGWGHEDGSFPAIAGQHRRVLIKQLADIRARNRDNPTMYPFSDPSVIGGAQAVADVAAYINSMPVNPQPGQGTGEALPLGRSLYEKHCVMCHGGDAEGFDVAYFPQLKNQHYNYLRRQLRWIRDGRRRNANPDMANRIADLTDAQMDAVSDYISRLR